MAWGCTTVDPGPQFVVPNQHFDQDFFFCHVEPNVIYGPNHCGDKQAGACHFTASAVTGMALTDHPLIDCGGGDHPLDPTQVGQGSAAQGNFQAASLEMNRDYSTAPFYLRPTQQEGHPIQLFPPNASDPSVQIISAWAAK